MCQYKSEGGRRCPIHRPDSLASINLVVKESGLDKTQVEDVFKELRREARTMRGGSDVREWTTYLRDLKRDVQNGDNSANNLTNVQKAFDGEVNAPDKATFYALQNLRTRAGARAQALRTEIQAVAEKTNRDSEAVEKEFKAAKESVEVTRTAPVPESYTKSAVESAQNKNLPSDRASVEALNRVSTVEQDQSQRVVSLDDLENHVLLSKVGYDRESGRMEMVMSYSPNTIYAYRNVPESKWQELVDSDYDLNTLDSVMSNPDHRYPTVEDYEREAYAVKCGDCGQFRAVSHACPTRTAVAKEQKAAPVPSSTETTVDAADMANENHAVDAWDPISVEVVEEEATPVRTELIPGVPHMEVSDEQGHFIPTIGRVEQEHPGLLMERQQEEIPATTQTPGGVNLGDCQFYSPRVLAGYYMNTDPERAKQFSELPSHMTVIVANNTAISEFTSNHNRHRNVIVDPVNPSLDVIATVDANHYAFQDNYRGTITMVPKKGRTEDLPVYTTQEASERRTAARNACVTALDNDEAVLVEWTTGRTRKYVYDASLAKQPLIRFAKNTDYRKALDSGKLAISNISVEVPYARRIGSNGFVDDQGYEADNYGYKVTGTVAMRKNEDGQVVLSEKHMHLTCNCYDYRTKRYCQHIAHTRRHVANVGQQTLPVKPRHSMLDSVLSKKEFVEVKGTDDNQYISFNGRTPLTDEHPNRSIDLPLTSNPRQLTRAEAASVYAKTRDLSKISYVSSIKDTTTFYRALKKADVEVGAKMSFYNADGSRYGGSSVTGRVKFAKSANGELSVKERNLKCTCADYREKYDCEHVRIAGDNANVLVESTKADEAGPFAYKVIASANKDHFKAQEYADDAMAMNPSADRDEELEKAYARVHEEGEARRERLRVATEERIEHYSSVMRQSRDRISPEDQAKEEAEFQSYRDAMMSRWENVEPGYGNDPEKFHADFEELSQKKEFEYKYENVLDGSATGPGARKFGVELEFVIDSKKNKSEALNAIARELHSEGMTESPWMGHYHSGQNSGWKKWSLESDCTVHGELVSPLMSDTKEDWEQLEKVCKIVKKHGGKVSKKAGSHVHVSSGSYGFSTAKHGELNRTVTTNEDLMYRLAMNPHAASHRGSEWCAPNMVDSGDDLDMKHQAGHHIFRTAHSNMLNMGASSNAAHKKSHVEFRMWDGTLDPGVIQQQVKLSVAMTDHAEREVIKNNGAKKSTKVQRKAGDSKSLEARVLAEAGTDKHTPETFMKSNGSAAELFDSLFRKQSDRRAAMHLFARTKWQKANS